MSKVIVSSITVCLLLLLGGCSAVSSAVSTTFKVAHGIGSLGVAGTKHSVQAAQAGISVAQGGLELAGVAIKLMDS